MLAGHTAGWSYYQLSRWLIELGSVSFKNTQMLVWKASYLQYTFNPRLVIISLLIIMLVTSLINNNTHLAIILHEYQFFKTFYILSFLWRLLKSLSYGPTVHHHPYLPHAFNLNSECPLISPKWNQHNAIFIWNEGLMLNPTSKGEHVHLGCNLNPKNEKPFALRKG